MADAIIYNCIWINHAPIRPIGAHQIADWLRKWGYTVTVIDFCNFITTEDLYKITLRHLDTNTKFIGVNSTFWSEVPYITSNFDVNGKPNTLEPQWLIDIREQLGQVNIDWVLGGVYASYPDRLFKYTWKKISGFGEDLILKYMDERSGKKRTLKPFDIVSLNSRFLSSNFIQPNEVLPIELSRGCQFKCSFCRYPLLGKKKGTYIRHMDCVREELLYNFFNFGTTKYFFMDDTVNESDEKISELAELAQKLPFKLQWVGYNRLDLIGSRRHSIETLKHTGLVSSYFGIESFHPTASKIIGKGWNGVHAKNFILELREHWGNDINFHLQFIVGLTGENEDFIDRTESWCIENKISDWAWNPLSIKQGDENFYWKSEFDRNYRMYGYKFINNNYWEWTNQDWTYTSALNKSRQLKEKDNNKFPSAWLLAELSSHGDNILTLMHTRRKDIDFALLHNKTRQFVNNYVSNMLSNNH